MAEWLTGCCKFLQQQKFLTLSLPWMAKAEFLVTMSYKLKQTSDENKEKY